MSEKIKHYLLITVSLALCLPLFFAVEKPSSSSFSEIAYYLSAVFGYIGLALLAFEFMLGTRSVAGVLFKDLTTKLSLHSLLGKYGLLLVFLHPILIAYSYGEKFYYPFLMQFGSETQKHITAGRFAFIGLLVIWVTSAIIKSKIAYRPWKYIHYISYPTLALSLFHVPPIGSNFSDTYIRIFWYVIVTVVLVCVALRLRHVFGFSKYVYEVVEHKQVSEKIWVMDLKPIGKKIKIKTGQYIYLQPDLISEEHPYSALNHDSKDGTISIGYKVFGKFTEKMTKTKVGDNYLVDGPYGVFTEELNKDSKKPAVFIAGGIGVTPFVKHCLESSGDRKLFYAVRTATSPAFKNVLSPAMGKNLIMVVEKDDSPAKENDERGFITKEIITKYLDTSKPYEFYICGPKQMMKATENILLELKVDKSRIHLENFSY